MKVRSLFLALPLLLSPALGQASGYVEHGSSAIWSLRQVSDKSGDHLPQDLLNLLGQNLIDLERHGVLIKKEDGKNWVPIEIIVSDMTVFRLSRSSGADVMHVLEGKEPIKEGLLKKLSAQWKEGLEDLMKEKTKMEGPLNAGKAYGAGFLAYHMTELTVVTDAAYNVAMNAAFNVAMNTAMKTATDAAMNAATDAAMNAPRVAARHAAQDAVDKAAWNAAWLGTMNASYNAAFNAATDAANTSIIPKLMLLSCNSASEFGQSSYDLAELFTLLWLTENGIEYLKKGFDAAYEKFPEMEIAQVKAVFEAAMTRPKLNDHMVIETLWRDLDALEKFVLAK